MSQQTAGVAWPVSDGTRVPYEIYTSQDVFNREQERIFRGPLWNYVALEAEIAAPGDFKTSFVGDTPVVVSRDGKRVAYSYNQTLSVLELISGLH